MSRASHFGDSDNCFRHRSDEFMSWLTQNPGVRVNPNIQIADLRSQGRGRGIVARTNILGGEELFALPHNVVLTVKNSKLKDHIPQDLEGLGPWLSLMAVMIYEYLLGEASAWFAYFKILPTKFDTLIFWSELELSELQVSAIINKIGKHDAQKSILECLAPIVRKHSSLFLVPGNFSPSDGVADTKALLDLAHRMGSLIMAYAFDLEKGEVGNSGDEDSYVTDDEEQLSKGMVPLADLLNADADRNNARLFQEEEFLVMRSIKDIKAGDELFNDYGEIPRADLLRRYGYVTDNYTQYDVVELPLTIICEAAGLNNAEPEDQPQLGLLEDFDLLDDGYSIQRPSSEASLPDIFPDELLMLTKTLTLTREQLLQHRSKNKPPKPKLGLREAQLLLQAVQKRWAQYTTSIEQDKVLLKKLAHLGFSVPSEQPLLRQRMATQVRLGEKEILQQLSERLTNYVTNLEVMRASAKRNVSGGNEGGVKKAKLRTR